MIYRPWHQSSCSIGKSSSLICRINKAFFTTFITYFKTSLWVSLIHIVFHQCLLVKYETERANLLIQPLFSISCLIEHMLMCFIRYPMCSSRKYPYPHHGGNWKFQRGGGSKSQEIPEGICTNLHCHFKCMQFSQYTVQT